jgi:hypothetical protein
MADDKTKIMPLDAQRIHVNQEYEIGYADCAPPTVTITRSGPPVDDLDQETQARTARSFLLPA